MKLAMIHPTTRSIYLSLLALIILSACEPAVMQVIPTDPPTETATFTPSPTRTPGRNASPTRATARPLQPGQPTPTGLFGATRTPLPQDFPTATRIFNSNAPRIEFFTSDPLAVEPGATVTLFWSSRGVNSAVIYRLEPDGTRAEVYNVGPDGNLPIDTARSDRGVLRFQLAIGEGTNYSEDVLTIPLQCPVEWFFAPPPSDCASTAPIETRIIDQQMERGRMIYIEETETVYALFNDGQQPTWTSFRNRYDPAIHAAREVDAPPEWIQPVDELGYVWRTDNDVRVRLGLGQAEGIDVNGFIQSAPAGRDRETLYISGANGVVVQIPPGNQSWQVIGAPR